MHIVYLVGKPEAKRPLRRPRSSWVDNFKMDLTERGWSDMHWIDVAQDRNRRRALVSMITNLQVPQNAGKLLSDFTSGGLSRRAQLHVVS
jgi:hypothetical protein